MHQPYSLRLRASARSFALVCRPVLSLLLLAAPVAAETVRLRWDPPADGSATSYLVERGTTAGVYSLAVPVSGTTTYDAPDLAVGTRYYFVVRSVNARGERSGPSNEISILVPVPAPTPVPSPTPTPTPTPTPQPPPTWPPAPAEPAAPVTVTVSSEAALRSALASLASNTVVALTPGTYQLTRPLVVTGSVSDVTISSSTGRAADVEILGPPATSSVPSPAAISVTAVVRLTIADLTIRNAPGYAIVLGAAVQQPRLQRLRIVDNGQFLQSNLHPNGAGAAGGLVESCTFEYTGRGVNLPSGLDIRGGRDWVVRLNRFTDPQPRTAVTFGPAVHAWQGSANTLVERNTFVRTSREIVFGLGNRTPNQHTGGVIRNNMIVRLAGTGARGPAISVLDSPAATVVHNTALLAGTSKVAIEYAHPDTRDVRIANNLADAAITAVDFATAILDNNVVTATASMFVAPTQGDLRLARTGGAAAIDRGAFVPSAAIDHEGQARPQGGAPDVGADELPPQ